MTFSELMLSEIGYKTKTTFWEDFSIADHFGIDAIRDTFQRAFNEWKTNVEFVTELVLVLNHKIWQHYQECPQLAELYDQLWRKCDAWCCDNLKEDDLAYYYQTLD